MSADRFQPDEHEKLLELRKQLEAESSDSLQVLSDPASNPVCSIAYDESIPGIVVTWKRYATSTQIRFIHEYVLGLLRKHGVKKILGDDSSLATIHTEDQTWIITDWMPRAIAAGLRVGASKAPDSYFGQLSVTSVQSETPQELETRQFDDLDEARRWLRQVET